MKRILHGAMGALALALMLSTPALADELSQCLSTVKFECEQALEGAKWYEVIAIQAFCQPAKLGCAVVTSPLNAMAT